MGHHLVEATSSLDLPQEELQALEERALSSEFHRFFGAADGTRFRQGCPCKCQAPLNSWKLVLRTKHGERLLLPGLSLALYLVVYFLYLNHHATIVLQSFLIPNHVPSIVWQNRIEWNGPRGGRRDAGMDDQSHYDPSQNPIKRACAQWRLWKG